MIWDGKTFHFTSSFLALLTIIQYFLHLRRKTPGQSSISISDSVTDGNYRYLHVTVKGYRFLKISCILLLILSYSGYETCS